MTVNAPNAPPRTPLLWNRTPLLLSPGLSRLTGHNIWLKYENLQPSGSFKSRGIGYYMCQRLSTNYDGSSGKTHFYISSGGNAGLACVHAAITLGTPSTIVVPLSTTPMMIEKLRKAGASDVIQHGNTWKEADGYLRDVVLQAATERGEQAVYVPPFDTPDVWTGHATMVQEIVEELSEVGERRSESCKVDAVVCSVGGGGLFCGVSQGLNEAGLSNVNILAMETKGADSLSQSLLAGELITLLEITSIATSLGAKRVAAQAFEYAKRSTVKSVVLTDTEAVAACLKFAEEERILVEPACGVSLAVCYEGRLKKALPALTADSNVVIVVCGGSNVSLDAIEKWRKEYT
ncbi:hypothetical protein V499_01685 [Pseudogymnoascus sp. VKM F-103]|nr:hypothetical protein V499_01685 [Pseudogymnoascus sp. VKM F-103]